MRHSRNKIQHRPNQNRHGITNWANACYIVSAVLISYWILNKEGREWRQNLYMTSAGPHGRDIVYTTAYTTGYVTPTHQQLRKIIQNVIRLHRPAPGNKECADEDLIRFLRKWTPSNDKIDPTTYLYTALNRTTTNVGDPTHER